MALLIALLLIPHSLISLTDPAAAEISRRADAERKINLAGRQRMLSQFMAKAACFASIGIRKAHHLNQLGQTHWLFSETLQGLRNGSSTLGLLPEKNPTVLSDLRHVEQEWRSYGQAVAAWRSEAARRTSTLNAIFERNLPLLSKMNAVVKRLEQAHSASGALDSGTAVALNISGRQRMLTQKASKEACLIYKGYEAERNRQRLLKTIDLFSISLTNLMNGNQEQGLPAAPVSIIQEQLESVSRLWKTFRNRLLIVQRSDAPPLEELAAIAELNEPLLFEMNKAVWLYEEIR